MDKQKNYQHFFQWASGKTIELGATPYPQHITVEELYRQFKERMLAEIAGETREPSVTLPDGFGVLVDNKGATPV